MDHAQLHGERRTSTKFKSSNTESSLDSDRKTKFQSTATDASQDSERRARFHSAATDTSQDEVAANGGEGKKRVTIRATKRKTTSNVAFGKAKTTTCSRSDTQGLERRQERRRTTVKGMQPERAKSADEISDLKKAISEDKEGFLSATMRIQRNWRRLKDARHVALIRIIYAEARKSHMSRDSYVRRASEQELAANGQQSGGSGLSGFVAAKKLGDRWRHIQREVCSDIASAVKKCVQAYKGLNSMVVDPMKRQRANKIRRRLRAATRLSQIGMGHNMWRELHGGISHCNDEKDASEEEEEEAEKERLRKKDAQEKAEKDAREKQERAAVAAELVQMDDNALYAADKAARKIQEIWSKGLIQKLKKRTRMLMKVKTFTSTSTFHSNQSRGSADLSDSTEVPDSLAASAPSALAAESPESATKGEAAAMMDDVNATSSIVNKSGAREQGSKWAKARRSVTLINAQVNKVQERLHRLQDLADEEKRHEEESEKAIEVAARRAVRSAFGLAEIVPDTKQTSQVETASTLTTKDAPEGSMDITIADVSGISKGESITISSGQSAETKRVVGISSEGIVTFDSALQSAYASGASVKAQAVDDPVPSHEPAQPAHLPLESQGFSAWQRARLKVKLADVKPRKVEHDQGTKIIRIPLLPSDVDPVAPVDLGFELGLAERGQQAKDGFQLVVMGITGGAVQQWNSNQEGSFSIRPGDVVVGVNGDGEWKSMAQKLASPEGTHIEIEVEMKTLREASELMDIAAPIRQLKSKPLSKQPPRPTVHTLPASYFEHRAASASTAGPASAAGTSAGLGESVGADAGPSSPDISGGLSSVQHPTKCQEVTSDDFGPEGTSAVHSTSRRPSKTGVSSRVASAANVQGSGLGSTWWAEKAETKPRSTLEEQKLELLGKMRGGKDIFDSSLQTGTNILDSTPKARASSGLDSEVHGQQPGMQANFAQPARRLIATPDDGPAQLQREGRAAQQQGDSLDGFWSRAAIKGDQLTWDDDGSKGKVIEKTDTTLKILWRGEEYSGKLGADGQLYWSDGDVWTRKQQVYAPADPRAWAMAGSAFAAMLLDPGLQVELEDKMPLPEWLSPDVFGPCMRDTICAISAEEAITLVHELQQLQADVSDQDSFFWGSLRNACSNGGGQGLWVALVSGADSGASPANNELCPLHLRVLWQVGATALYKESKRLATFMEEWCLGSVNADWGRQLVQVEEAMGWCSRNLDALRARHGDLTSWRQPMSTEGPEFALANAHAAAAVAATRRLPAGKALRWATLKPGVREEVYSLMAERSQQALEVMHSERELLRTKRQELESSTISSIGLRRPATQPNRANSSRAAAARRAKAVAAAAAEGQLLSFDTWRNLAGDVDVSIGFGPSRPGKPKSGGCGKIRSARLRHAEPSVQRLTV